MLSPLRLMFRQVIQMGVMGQTFNRYSALAAETPPLSSTLLTVQLSSHLFPSVATFAEETIAHNQYKFYRCKF